MADFTFTDTAADDSFEIQTGQEALGVDEVVQSSFQPGTFGIFEVFSDGSYTYTPNNAAINGVRGGETPSESFAFSILDEDTEAVIRDVIVSFEVTGANDDARFSVGSDNSGTVVEDGLSTSSGNVTVFDIDSPQTLRTGVLNGSFGTLNVSGSGWSYVLNNAAVQSLGVTDVETETFFLSSFDGSAEFEVTITIEGTNDAPTLSARSFTVTEDTGVQMANFASAASDIDNGAVLTFSLPTPVAGASITSGGIVSIDTDNAAYQSVARGETRAVVVNVRVTDENNEFAENTLTVNVVGVNDAPVANAAMRMATEDGGVFSGMLTASDVDTGAVLTFSQRAQDIPQTGNKGSVANVTEQGLIAGLTINSNGSYTFDANHPDYDSIAVGQTRQVVANYRVTDQFNAFSTSTLTINVTGVNDAPVITSAAQTATLAETNVALSASGQVRATDIDATDNLTFMVDGSSRATNGRVLTNAQSDALFQAFSLQATGAWSYNLASPDFLNDGDTVTLTYRVNVSDGNGGTTFQNVVITINGRDEIFVGGAGSDTFEGTAFDDQINGGAGFDTLDLSEGSGPVSIDFSEGSPGTVTGNGGVDTVENIENFILTGGADTFIGGNAGESVTGGEGDDDIETNGGDDKVFAGGGNDLVHGGAGPGDDYYDGGAGTADTLTYASTTLGVVVDLNAIDRSGNAAVAAILAGVPLPTNTPVGLATGAEIGTDAFVNFENVTGGSGDDSLTGNSGANVINGGDGNDLLDGRGGDDTLIGGLGIDTITYASQSGAVQVNLLTGNVNAGAQGGNDTVSGVENAILTGADDQFIGDAGDNTVTGGLGNDQLNGGAGIDTAIFANSVATNGLAVEVDVPGLHALVLGTSSGDGQDTVQNFERLVFGGGTLSTADDVTIRIVNSNAVVATVNNANMLNESELMGPPSTRMGNVLTNDINLDADANDVAVVTGFSSNFSETSAVAGGTLTGQYGTLVINANGSYLYTANASTNSLGAGDTFTDVFTYSADDGDDGDSDTATLTITINGVDDAAVITGARTGSVTEDLMVSETGFISTTGTLTAVDPDTDESGFIATSITRPTGTFAINAAGVWTFTANNGATIIQQIGATDSLTETFNVSSIGGTPSSVTITINGVNDDPVAGAVTFAAPAATLTVPANSVNNTLGTAIVLTGGSLNANPDIYNSTVVPHITIIAATDATPDFYSYSFTNVAFTGPGTYFTVDIDGVVGSTPAVLTAFFNGFSIGSSTQPFAFGGSLPFDIGTPTNPLLQLSSSGSVTGTLQFSVGSAASNGSAGLGVGNGYVLHVSLVGGTVLPSTFSGTFEETNAALSTSGTVAFTDIDTNDTPQAAYTAATGLSASVAGGPQLTTAQAAVFANAFSITDAGAFSFNVASPDYLGDDDVLTLTYTVNITDDHGGSTTRNVVIIVNGNNDQPVITSAAQTATLDESAEPAQLALSASGAVTASDVDNGDILSFSLAEGGTSISATGTVLTLAQQNTIRAGFTLNANGTWTYNIASPDFLGDDDVVTLTNTVEVRDGNGGSTSQNVVITINGTNDAPDILPGSGAGYTPSLTETNLPLSISGNVNFRDVDNGDTPEASYTAATDASVTATGITLTAPQIAAIKAGFTLVNNAGNYTYNLASPDYLALGDVVTAVFNVHVIDDLGVDTVQPITITITGTNDAPVLANSVFTINDTAAYDLLSFGTSAGFSFANLASDIDSGDTRTFELVRVAEEGEEGENASFDEVSGNTFIVTDFGTITVATNGAVSFVANDAAINALNPMDVHIRTFTVRVTDNNGASALATLTVTINGANDNPIAPSPLVFVPTTDNEGLITINLLRGETGTADDAFDPDAGGSVAVDPMGFTVSVASSALTNSEILSIQSTLLGIVPNSMPNGGGYTFNTALFDTLDLGETATITFSYFVRDATGNSVARTATQVVHGRLEIATSLTEGDDIFNGGNFGDLIDGLDGDDVLNGNAGNDVIIGGAGDDRISGGSGDDMLSGGNGDDNISGGSGIDIISGGDGTDTISGGSEDDIISGGAGADRIDGGAGFDTATYASATEGVSFNLTAGTATGGDANGDTFISIESYVGSAFNDTIIGSAGNDTIEGGAGNDVLVGGAGIDTISYAGSAFGVTVHLDNPTPQDTLQQGIDTISGFENILGSSQADALYGDDFDNVITAGAGFDTITSGGGTNTLIGGDGGDLYFVQGVNDVIIEAVGGGYDIVLSQVNFTLGAGSEVEALAVNTSAGISLTGNEFQQVLTGNVGSDTLDGGGGNDLIISGLGTNTLIGGTGDDIYYSEGLNDIITEAAGGGFDVVLASGNLTLAAGSEVEFIAVNTANGVTITGSNSNQTIQGAGGNDRLIGGLGNDRLQGSGGADTFVLGNTFADRDFIVDFASGSDRLEISAALFGGGLAAGVLSASQFLSGAGATAATTADQRFIYNSSNGNLLFDADGNGAGAAVLFASLLNVPALTAADFLIAG